MLVEKIVTLADKSEKQWFKRHPTNCGVVKENKTSVFSLFLFCPLRWVFYVYICFLFIDLGIRICVWKRIKVEKTVKVEVCLVLLVADSKGWWVKRKEKKRKECFGLEREENVGMNAMEWNGIWISFLLFFNF